MTIGRNDAYCCRDVRSFSDFHRCSSLLVLAQHLGIKVRVRLKVFPDKDLVTPRRNVFDLKIPFRD